MSHDAGQGGLAQSGRATEKNVVENILTLLRSLNGYLQTILDLCLTGEIRSSVASVPFPSSSSGWTKLPKDPLCIMPQTGSFFSVSQVNFLEGKSIG